MARQVSNVDIITDSFEILILQTNELLNSLSTEIITANATYSNTGTTANPRTAQLYGTLGANTITVTDAIQGGNVNGLSANLVISTNATAYSASDANIKVLVGNSSVNSYLGTDTLALGLGTANTLANTTLIKVEDTGSSANMTADGFVSGISVINTTAVAVGANVIANSSALLIGNSSVNTTISSATVTTDGTLDVLGATTLSNTLSIAGNTTFKTDYVIDVASNTNLGDDSAPKQIYSFAKATYNSAKFQVKIDQEDGSVTQSSEILLALSASSNAVSITTYGSVASNGTPSALGTFVANVTATNARLYLDQTVVNSAVKVVAHLIK